MKTKPCNEIFALSFQMIIDDFEDYFPYLNFYIGKNIGKLQGIRFLKDIDTLQSQFVYIASASTFPQSLPEGAYVFILSGSITNEYQGGMHSFIFTPEETPMSIIFNIASQTFERYFQWDRQLQNAVSRNAGALELFEISYQLFRNPLFVHDAHFHVTACPVQTPEMLTWELDERTGELIVPLDVIHAFKMDREYLQTLSTHGAHMFSANIRGYRILYINLWDQGRYEGRICINELQHAIKKGHFIALEHFAHILQEIFHRRNMEPNSFYRSFDNTLIAILENRLTDEKIIAKRLSYMGWDLNDNYVVMSIDIAARDIDTLAVIGICNHIECQNQGSYAFLYKSSIFILLNLTAGKTDTKEYVSKLADMLREGYHKMGISEAYNHITHLKLAHCQAKIALCYGNQSDSMVWYYYFSDYALDYFVDQVCQKEKMDFFCNEGLFRLMLYDEKNSSELFKTLRVYLDTERNSVKTAKLLFIHRSTLLYRLERIQQIAGFDLDNPKIRLHLCISFLLIDRNKSSF